MKRFVIAACSLLALGACDSMNDFASSKPGATVASSKTGQTIKIVTKPVDANCAVDRDNMTIERVNGTPGSATFAKTGKDLVIRCLKSGYQQETFIAKANADKSYPSLVEMTLKSKRPSAPMKSSPKTKK
jgi:hypothetical protein